VTTETSISLRRATPLSASQRALLASQLRSPQDPVHNRAHLLRLGPDINAQRLADAFDVVVGANDVLRTTIDTHTANDTGTAIVTGTANDTHTASDTHTAIVAPTSAACSEIIELPASAVEVWALARSQRLLDLSSCAWDSVIITHHDGTLSWFCNLHHLVTDARSYTLLVEATAAAYADLTPQPITTFQAQVDPASMRDDAITFRVEVDPDTVPPLPPAVAEKLAAEKKPNTAPSYYRWASAVARDRSPARQRAHDHWVNRMPVPLLDRLYAPRDEHSAQSSRIPVDLQPAVANRIEKHLDAVDQSVTPEVASTNLLVTAAALYAHQLTGVAAVSVGLPVLNRRAGDSQTIIGPLVELFPVDIMVEDGDTAASLHQRVSDSVITTLRHAHPGTAPDADFSIVVNVIPGSGVTTFADQPATAQLLSTDAMDANHLLRVELTGYAPDGNGRPSGFGGQSSLHLDVNTVATPPAVHESVSNHFASILDFLVTSPNALIAKAPLVTAPPVTTPLVTTPPVTTPLVTAPLVGPVDTTHPEQSEIGPPSAAALPIAKRLQRVLEANDNMVIVEDDDHITGRELWQWVGALAAELRSEERVTVELSPSTHAVACVYAAVVAGVPFVPIDPTIPLSQRDSLATRAGASRRVRSAADVDHLRRSRSVVRIPAVPAANANDEAYVLFTSDSTRDPDSVSTTHEDLANNIASADGADFAGDGSAPPATLPASLAFDRHITTLFAPILRGESVKVTGHIKPDPISEPDRHVDSELAVGSAKPAVLIGPALTERRLVISQIRVGMETRPDAPAVTCGDTTITWADLDQRSSAIAATLLAQGVSRGDRVIVALERSVEAVVAILGVHRAGAAYVPIDPTYPSDRFTLIANAANCDVALVGPNTPATGADRPVVVTSATVSGLGWADLPLWAEDVALAEDDEAYVIFTSGSTGVPNAVAVTHGQLAASTNARAQFYEPSPQRFGLLSSMAFDSSVVGLFWTLAAGGEVIMPTEGAVHDVDALVDLFRTARLTHTLCVPTLYGALLARRERRFPDDRTEHWPGHVIVAGEACGPSLVAAHFDACSASDMTNEYGPTEATVWATAHRCSPADGAPGARSVPIGVPIAGAWVAIADEEGLPVLGETIGELLIGGAGVTNGYADPARTADRFSLTTPAQQGAGLPAGRYFRSGDTASIVHGLINFHGRSDNQLNIGGTRVEPDDVEAALSRHPDVATVIVGGVDVRSVDELMANLPADDVREAMQEASESGHHDPQIALAEALRVRGEPRLRLIAHLEVPDRSDHDTVIAEVRTLAGASLPSAMRPTLWSAQPSLPRTPNGKVDRRTVLTSVPAEPGPALTEVPAEPVRPVAAVGPVAAVAGAAVTPLAATPAAVTSDAVTSSAVTSVAPQAGDDDDRPLATPPASQQLRSLVIPLQTSGDRPPIFALHHLGSNGALFRPLAGELGTDQPMYGLAAPEPVEPAGHDIETITRTYVNEVQRLAPTGPVIIAGAGPGALFAYEVSQQLREHGRDVSLLVMLADDYKASESVPRDFVELREQGWTGVKQALSARGPGHRIRRQAEIVAVRAARKLERPLSHRLQVRAHIEENLDHVDGWQHSPYPGSALVIRGAEHQASPGRTPEWDNLVNDLSMERVPGWGLTILEARHIRPTAAIIQSTLAAL